MWYPRGELTRRYRALCFATLLGALPAIAAVSTLAPRAAHAEVEAYKQHMDNGVKLFTDHNYPAAIAEFQAAYQLKPKASPLINTALCYKAQFKYPKAIETLETALAKHADTMDDADKKAAEDAITEMKALLAYVKVNVTPAEAAVTVDGELQAKNAEQKVPVAPGVHRIGAKLDGYTGSEQEISVASGDQKELTLTLTAASATPADAKDPGKPVKKPPTRYSTSLMVMGIVVSAVGFVSGGSGILLYAAANQCATKTAPDPSGICDDPKRSKGGAVALMAVGVVGLGVGIPMAIVGNGPPAKAKTPPPPTKAALPTVLIGPTSAAVRWAF